MELLCVLIVAVVTQMYPLLTLIELYVQRELILWCVNLGIKKNENTRTYIYTNKFLLKMLEKKFSFWVSARKAAL